VVVPPRGLFAAGKFDQYKRDVPYATLAQAFQMLVRQILVASEAEVDHWRHALLKPLGTNGQLMVNLMCNSFTTEDLPIPEVEFVIGKQPPVVELPPQEARGRFQLVFRRFLPEYPDTNTSSAAPCATTRSNAPISASTSRSLPCFFGHQQSVRRVVRGQREWIDAAVRPPFRQAAPKIGFQTRSGLIALLRIFGEEFHDYGG
jgi:hypothetical protein